MLKVLTSDNGRPSVKHLRAGFDNHSAERDAYVLNYGGRLICKRDTVDTTKYIVAPGMAVMKGIVIENTEDYELPLIPGYGTTFNYSIILEYDGAIKEAVFKIQPQSTPLIQNDLFLDENGVYQMVIATFRYGAGGVISTSYYANINWSEWLSVSQQPKRYKPNKSIEIIKSFENSQLLVLKKQFDFKILPHGPYTSSGNEAILGLADFDPSKPSGVLSNFTDINGRIYTKIRLDPGFLHIVEMDAVYSPGQSAPNLFNFMAYPDNATTGNFVFNTNNSISPNNVRNDAAQSKGLYVADLSASAVTRTIVIQNSANSLNNPATLDPDYPAVKFSSFAVVNILGSDQKIMTSGGTAI